MSSQNLEIQLAQEKLGKGNGIVGLRRQVLEMRETRAQMFVNEHQSKDQVMMGLVSECIGAFLQRDETMALDLLSSLPIPVDHIKTGISCSSSPMKEVSNASLLQLACINGWLKVVEVLVTKHNCSLAYTNDSGYNCLHYACAEGHDDIVCYLVNKMSVDANASCDDGKTALHFASICDHEGCVRELLFSTTCNPVPVDADGKTPFHYAISKGIINILQSRCGNIESSVKVLILGETSPFYSALVEDMSTGPICPGVIPLPSNGGKRTIYAVPDHVQFDSGEDSPLAITTPSLFVVSIRSHRRGHKATQQLYYWLQLVCCIASSTTATFGLAVAITGEAKEELEQDVRCIVEKALKSYRGFEFLETIHVDRTTNYKQVLNQTIERFSNKISKHTSPALPDSYLLYKHLISIDKSCSAIKLLNFVSILKRQVPSYSVDFRKLIDVLSDLSNRAIITFLRNKESLIESWIILDLAKVLLPIIQKIKPNVYRPQAYSPILHRSDLQNLSPEIDDKACMHLLQYFHICQVLNSRSLSVIFKQNAGSVLSDFFFFPLFLPYKGESESLLYDHSYVSTWVLRCQEEASYFPKCFTQILSLYFAYMFPFGPQCKLTEPLQHCSLWNGNLIYRNENGTKVAIETFEQNKAVVFTICSEETSKVSHVEIRSAIIDAILSFYKQLCPFLRVGETLMRQSNAIYGEVHMKNIVIAMMNESVSVKGIDGNDMLLKDVLTFDLFEGIPRVIIEKLFDKFKASKRISDKTLKTLADCMARRHDPYLFGHQVLCSQKAAVIIGKHRRTPTNQFYELLCNWRSFDSEGGTYSSLCKLFSRYSVCAGRNPLQIGSCDEKDIWSIDAVAFQTCTFYH